MPYSTDRIKVTHILTDSNIGGAGRLLCYQLERGDHKRFEYSVILPENAALIPKLEAIGVKVYTAQGIADRSNAPAAKPALVALLKEIKPDILHTHSSRTGRFAGVEAGVPIIILSKHCSDMPPAKLGKFPYNILAAREWKKTLTGAIATDDMAADALAAEGLPREKIKVIYNGAPALRVLSDEEKANLRAELGYCKNDLIVGIFARIEPVKDHETLLKAAEICRNGDRIQDIKILVVGDGSRSWYVDQTAENLEIESVVKNYGFADDIAPLMNICDINVNCSVGTETSNLAIIEGMSLGVVPIVSDLESNKRLIGDCGLVFERESASDLANAIRKLYDREERVSLSAAAKARYEAHYTSERFARDVEDYYLTLFNENNQM